MSFYNPFMKTPDYSQGINDIMQQIMMFLVMKKMFPGQKTSPQQGMTELPQQGLLPGSEQNILQSAPPQMGTTEFPQGPPPGLAGVMGAGGMLPGMGGISQGLPPELAQYIMQLLGGGGRGF